MAISVSNIAFGSGSGLIATAPQTSVVGRMYIALVAAYQSNTPDPYISNALGITWTKIGNTVYGPTNGTACLYWGVSNEVVTGVWDIVWPTISTSYDWSNMGNALTSDGTYASVQASPNTISNSLMYNLADIGVPSGAIVTSVNLNGYARTTSATNSKLTSYFANDIGTVESGQSSAYNLTFTTDNTWTTFSSVSLIENQNLAIDYLLDTYWNSGSAYLDISASSTVQATLDVDYMSLSITYATGTTTTSPVFTTTPVLGVFPSGATWSNMGNALTSDGTYATQVVANNGTNTDDMRFKLSDLGLPANAIITNFTVTALARTTKASRTQLQFQLTAGASGSEVFYGTYGYITFNADNTWETHSLSGTDDQWVQQGAQLTSNWWNSSGYLDVWVVNSSSSSITCDVDYIQMAVTYTTGNTTKTQNFTTTPIKGVNPPTNNGGIYNIDYVSGVSFNPIVQASLSYTTSSSLTASLNPFSTPINGTYYISVLFDTAIGIFSGTAVASASGGSGGWSTSTENVLGNGTYALGCATAYSTFPSTSTTITYGGVSYSGSTNPRWYGLGIELGIIPAASTTSLTNSAMLLGMGI